MSVTIREADPPVAVFELTTFEVGLAGFPSTFSGPEPLIFPMVQEESFAEDQIPHHSPYQVCAIARDADQVILLSGASDPVQPILGHVIGASLTLSPVDDGKVPPPCDELE